MAFFSKHVGGIIGISKESILIVEEKRIPFWETQYLTNRVVITLVGWTGTASYDPHQLGR